MRSHLIVSTLLLFCWQFETSIGHVGNMVCYYDAFNAQRSDSPQMTIEELTPALYFCNYLVYGYAAIDSHSYQLTSGFPQLDINSNHYRSLTSLKRKFPNLRVLLSVGGDRDDGEETEVNKYLTLLEEKTRRDSFVNSAVNMLQTYGFDGLDLAWQFPKNPPKKIVGAFRGAWNTFKGWFKGTQPVDVEAAKHKLAFTSLVHELNVAFLPRGYTITFTMLPHVDPELFIDVSVIAAAVDFVNLATYDFYTPVRDPKQADHPAPIYPMYERDIDKNINYQVDFWLNHTVPANRLNIGIPAYGLVWAMSAESGITGYPPIPKTLGAPEQNNATGHNQRGMTSWSYICAQLTTEDPTWRLRKVGDPTKRYGNYAYRAAELNEATKVIVDGVWVGYDGPDFAAIKAGYANARNLGGVALFDLSHDDFKGTCAGEKYPILRSIKHRL